MLTGVYFFVSGCLRCRICAEGRVRPLIVMDNETIQKLKDCDILLKKLETSQSKVIVLQVQEILFKNIDIIKGKEMLFVTFYYVYLS